jgi:hypothetical protein
MWQDVVDKATKGKKPMKESNGNPKLPTVMMQANMKFVMGKLILTVDVLKQAGKSCVELHNYDINNYKKTRNNSVVQGRALSDG